MRNPSEFCQIPRGRYAASRQPMQDVGRDFEHLVQNVFSNGT